MKRKSMLALLLAVSMTCSMTAATGAVAYASDDTATEETADESTDDAEATEEDADAADAADASTGDTGTDAAGGRVYGRARHGGGGCKRQCYEYDVVAVEPSGYDERTSDRQVG